MRKFIKTFFKVSYVVSLSTLVFLGGVVSRVTEKGSHDKDGKTVLGSDLIQPVNFAHADIPGGDGQGDDDCDGGGDGGDDA